MTAATQGRTTGGRPFDYLYDSSYLVSGARDYARTSFKAAMGSAQIMIQPVYRSMFSELREFPRMNVVYHTNCRLPDHLDRSYNAYVSRVASSNSTPNPRPAGRDLYMYIATPKKLANVQTISPDFHPSSPIPTLGSNKPRNRGTQSLYRESSAQTIPWQPDGKPAKSCENTPEQMYLDKLEWGPGNPYRTGDLPADFHTTEIINKMRHARAWLEVAERGNFPRFIKKRDQIIEDVETKDWIFREAEIDELQGIRLSLLHKMQTAKRNKLTNKTSRKLAQRWEVNKQKMQEKINNIRHSRDREMRKLTALHTSGGRLGMVQRLRAARAMGSNTIAACDPTSDVHATMYRHGYQARNRHAEIFYDPSLLQMEDHKQLAKIPEWLIEAGTNLTRTFSGHHLPKDPTKLCERESKWSEDYLANLYSDLRKARMGVAATAGPLHVMKPRRLCDTPRPETPEVESVLDGEETSHQSALLLQRIIRGRAVQCLMYEGRTRAAELTEELKTTHGLQKEDKMRIAKEEARAREYTAQRTEAEQKEDAVQALVDELCGGAVSAALDFLEKELRRLKEERRQHAFILIALREKQMREAAEAGRRQKEEHRRREHDEMFKRILGVTQETVDSYLESIVHEATIIGSEFEAVRRAELNADKIEAATAEYDSMSTAEQNELVAELVHQFLLPEVHKTAAKHKINAVQAAKMETARRTIFGLLDNANVKKASCTQCGTPLGEICRCLVCPVSSTPVATVARDDPRWMKVQRPAARPEKSWEERIPPQHDFRCMLDSLVDEVVVKSRKHKATQDVIGRDVSEAIRTHVEIALEAKDVVKDVVKSVLGETQPPVKQADYHVISRMIRKDALERTEPAHLPCKCPKVLPSEIRRIAEEKAAKEGGACICVTPVTEPSVTASGLDYNDPEQRKKMLPSEIRVFEDLKKCKCDCSESSTQYPLEGFDSVSWTELPELNEDQEIQERDHENDSLPPNEEDV